MKKMRRIAALLLAGAMTSALLAGCGGTNSGAGQGAGNDGGAAAGESQAAGENQAAGGDSDVSADGSAAEVEDISLTFTTTYQETEYAGQVVQHFISYLSEKSGGKIKIEPYWGGTFAGNGEELSFVNSDAADMTLIGQSTYTDVLPLLNFPSQVSGGYQAAVDLMNYVVFENDKTAPLAQAQIAAQNVKMLGAIASGSNAFIAKSEYASLAEMAGMKLGVGMNQSAYESLGFNVVTVMPWDYYDNLSRGIADCGYMSITALVSMKLHEVTPYFMADGTYTAGNFFTINLDKWNGMSDAAKTLFEEAMADTQKYSIELSEQLDAEAGKTIEAAGGKLITLPDGDVQAVQSALFTTGVADARSYATSAGCTDDMETVLSVVSERLGMTLE